MLTCAVYIFFLSFFFAAFSFSSEKISSHTHLSDVENFFFSKVEVASSCSCGRTKMGNWEWHLGWGSGTSTGMITTPAKVNGPISDTVLVIELPYTICLLCDLLSVIYHL